MYSNDIRVVENYISNQDLEILQNFVRTTDQWERTDSWLWDNRNINTRNILDKNISDICLTIENKMKIDMTNFFNIKKDIRPELFLFSRRFPSPGETPHSDSSGNAGEDNGTSHRKYSSLFYINDDFDGGELHFPNQNFTFVPKQNTAVMFPSTFEHLHGVKELFSGMRYTMLAFWVYTDTIDNDTKVEN